MNQTKILLVEDHRDIAEVVVDYLTEQGFNSKHTTSGNGALELVDSNENFDLIILDVMLPGIDGLEVCRRIRASKHANVPILMLTARDTLEDKLSGFENGADDYLVKPFDVEELVARTRALISRSRREPAASVLELADLRLDVSAMQVERNSQQISLTPIGIRILHLLLRNSPHVVHRRDIEREIWGELPPDSDALRSHMYNLRKAIDKPFAHPLIHTVHNIGFRLSDESTR
ncbi:MAG: response regulator transcription factor [Gammaproteobacteria bacterium]